MLQRTPQTLTLVGELEDDDDEMEIENDPDLSIGAKMVYAKFLQYAWHKNHCYPGQQRLGEELGLTEGRVSQLVKELKEAELLEVKRRGLGKTNMYILKCVVQKKSSKNVDN